MRNKNLTRKELANKMVTHQSREAGYFGEFYEGIDRRAKRILGKKWKGGLFAGKGLKDVVYLLSDDLRIWKMKKNLLTEAEKDFAAGNTVNITGHGSKGHTAWMV